MYDTVVLHGAITSQVQPSGHQPRAMVLYPEPTSKVTVLSSPNLSFTIPLQRGDLPVISFCLLLNCAMLMLFSLTQNHFSYPLIANLPAETLGNTQATP